MMNEPRSHTERAARCAPEIDDSATVHADHLVDASVRIDDPGGVELSSLRRYV
jgi:hypothetical protein